MSFEDFVEVHKDDSLSDKLSWLRTQIDILNSDRYHEGWFAARDSLENVTYFYKESVAIRERINWLISEIAKAIGE